MNQRAPTRMSHRLRQASHCLALLLAPALAPGLSWAVPRTRPAPGLETAVQPRFSLQPYLRAVGAPPLRFAEKAPPPDLVTRPPASGMPPAPDITHEPEVEATTREILELSADSGPTAEFTAIPPPDPSTLPASAQPPTEPAPDRTEPAPILPDDTRSAVRPEDFLPFFQLPGTGNISGNTTVIVPVGRQAPAPGTLPPSSATYRQSP